MFGFQVLVLAAIQGFSEFLPISSSGHLILLPFFFNWPLQPLAFDIALHMGTLLAIIAYFRRELVELLKIHHPASRRLLALLAIGSLPAFVAGGLFNDLVERSFRHPLVVAGMLILVGLALLYVDKKFNGAQKIEQLTLRKALWIGLLQTLALVPGASRSASTIMGGLIGGLTRVEAARFSFLLSIPVIFGAGAFATWEMWRTQQTFVWSDFMLGSSISALGGLLTMGFFLKYLTRHSFWPFVLYRLALGVLIASLWVLKG